MDSPLSPEAYRRLLYINRDRADEINGSLDPQQSHQQQTQQLLSFVDWDVLDGAGTARMLDQYARLTRRAPSRKRPLRKPAHNAALSPLPLLQTTSSHTTGSAMSLTPQSVTSRPPSRSESDEGKDTYGELWLDPWSPQRPQSSSPSKPRKRSVPPRPILPPLDVQVLQRRRVFLSVTGAATIGIEEILQLHERPQPPISTSNHHSSPLQLALIPKRCSSEDEVALMPCHSLLYRFVPSLTAEIWRETIRDRDKNWVNDELNVVLALSRASQDRTKCFMSNSMRLVKGKWHHWEAMKLHIHSHEPKIEVSAAAVSPHRDQSVPLQILIRNQGAMISKTYCLVSVFGVGIYGRLYSSGLAERHGNTRYLRFKAYDPQTSRVFELLVTFSDLEWLFEARKELLAAGKKHVIIKELIALLYFRYPGDEGEDEDDDELGDHARKTLPSSMHSSEEDTRAGESQRTEPHQQLFSVLCISPEEKLNAAARRRREREERLRLEEAERLRALALFMKLPRRARYRVVCQVVRVNGHKLIVSVYHNPSQIRNFVILAYHPLSSRTFPLTVGVMEVASLSRIFTLPHRWSAELKLQIARSLLPMLRFNGAKKTSTLNSLQCSTGNDDYADYRMGLGIREDRSGSPSDWLPPPAIQTLESLQTELVAKFEVDGHRSLKLDSQAQLQQLEATNTAKIADLETQIRDAEAQKANLQAQDHELKEKIEEINSGKGVVLEVTASEGGQQQQPKGQHHERRREFKASRAKIKDDLKVLSDQMTGYKREILKGREHETLEREKASAKLEKAIKTLENEALISTRGILPAESGSRDRRQPLKQKTWLSQAHIDPNLRFVASGACNIEGKRYRCSVFEVLDLTDEETTTTSLEAQQSQSTTFQVTLYDPTSCHTHTLKLSRLDWIAYTKPQHDAQLLIPEFKISSSPVTERLGFLSTSLATCRESLTALMNKKKKKKLTKKSLKQREQLRLDMQNCLLERKKLYAEAPWHVLISALGERLSVSGSGSDEVSIDRCIFRTVLPIVSIAEDNDDERPGGHSQKTRGGDDAEGVVYCHVRVVQKHETIGFEVFEPLNGTEYAIVYPESVELVKEFAIETFLEQQMHLEAVAMSLLFFVNDVTGQVDIQFED